MHRACRRIASERGDLEMDTDGAGHDVRAAVTTALRRSQRHDRPYRHWFLADVLPSATARALAALPVTGAAAAAGRRESANATRVFVGTEMQAQHAVCAELARAFQAPETVAAIHDATAAPLDGGSLRIEYAVDGDGFWLEPHTDIGAKRLTFLIYLNDWPGAEDYGTDIYAGADRASRVGRSPAGFNAGFAFVPAEDTWHGFEPRPVPAPRRSLIVNYVGPEWRNRHELAFPDDPVRV